MSNEEKKPWRWSYFQEFGLRDDELSPSDKMREAAVSDFGSKISLALEEHGIEYTLVVEPEEGEDGIDLVLRLPSADKKLVFRLDGTRFIATTVQRFGQGAHEGDEGDGEGVAVYFGQYDKRTCYSIEQVYGFVQQWAKICLGHESVQRALRGQMTKATIDKEPKREFVVKVNHHHTVGLCGSSEDKEETWIVSKRHESTEGSGWVIRKEGNNMFLRRDATFAISIVNLDQFRNASWKLHEALWSLGLSLGDILECVRDAREMRLNERGESIWMFDAHTIKQEIEGWAKEAK